MEENSAVIVTLSAKTSKIFKFLLIKYLLVLYTKNSTRGGTIVDRQKKVPKQAGVVYNQDTR